MFFSLSNTSYLTSMILVGVVDLQENWLVEEALLFVSLVTLLDHIHYEDSCTI